MKPFASISLDLDNQWSYMKTHGDPEWVSYPSYYDIFIPHVVELLRELNLKITFFIVGLDATFDENKDYLQELVNNGHEIGNHSFSHEIWLPLRSKDAILQEIMSAHESISRATGKEPTGFRGPGFSWSAAVFRVLANIGYAYDASILPTYIGPLAKKYFFWKSNLDDAEKRKRKDLFGGFKNGLLPVQPFLWQLNDTEPLVEIPVTTMPYLKIPFHLSYLLYLSQFSNTLMFLYLRMALYLCSRAGLSPSFLLHPLDLIGGDKVSALRFFPGMQLSSEKKLTVFRKIFAILSRQFELVGMTAHVRHATQSQTMLTLNPEAYDSRPR